MGSYYDFRICFNAMDNLGKHKAEPTKHVQTSQHILSPWDCDVGLWEGCNM